MSKEIDDEGYRTYYTSYRIPEDVEISEISVKMEGTSLTITFPVYYFETRTVEIN